MGSAQSDAFHKCFALCGNNGTAAFSDGLTDVHICDAHWSLTQSSCLTWLEWTAGWAIALFVLSWIFLSAVCICCCGSTRCSCLLCGKPEARTRRRVFSVRAVFLVAVLATCVLAVFTGLTSMQWGRVSDRTLAALTATVDSALGTALNATDAVATLCNATSSDAYLSAARSDASAVSSLVSPALAADVTKVAAAAHDARTFVDDVSNVIDKVFSSSTLYGRPMLTLYALGLLVAALILCVFAALFPLCCTSTPNARSLGCALGVASFAMWAAMSISLSVAVSSFFLVSDVCAVWDAEVRPFVQVAAKKGKVCDHSSLTDAAVFASKRFEEFLAQSHTTGNICSDLASAGATAVPGCGAPLNTTFVDSTRYVYDVGAFVDAVRAAHLHGDRVARITSFTTNIAGPIATIIITARHDLNCSLFDRDLINEVGPRLCTQPDGENFKDASARFTAVGVGLMLCAALTLVAGRWAIEYAAVDERAAFAARAHSMTEDDLHTITNSPARSRSGSPAGSTRSSASSLQADYARYARSL